MEQWTIAQWCREVGGDRKEFARRVSAANVKPSGKEEADKLALANSRSRGELVEVATITRLGQKVMAAVRNRILGMPLTDEEKDGCLRELLALADMDWTREV